MAFINRIRRLSGKSSKNKSQRHHKAHDHSTLMKTTKEDSPSYETTLVGKGQHGVASKKALMIKSTKLVDNYYSTDKRDVPPSEYSESSKYCYPLAVGDATCTTTTDEESESRNFTTDSATTVHYSSISERDTSAMQTRVPSNYIDHIYENVCPRYKVKPGTQPGGEKTSSRDKPKIEEHLKEAKEQKHQQEQANDITQKDKATKMPATKMKSETKLKPERQTSLPAPLIDSKITQKQQTPHKEIPEIEEHLEEFRDQLNQLTPQGCSDITSMVVSNLNFAARMMDKKGGRLQLISHGVMLYIPPGALGDEPQEIFIYVQQSLKSSHHTVKNGFVTPIVHCGTSGLKFKIPVILTFPVNVKSSSGSKLTGVRQDSSTKPWADISDCSSEVVLFHDGLCTVVSDHFTGYGAVEEPNDPPVSKLKLKAAAFIPQNGAIDHVHGCLQLRVRIWDESSETTKAVEDAEENSTAMDTQRRLFLNTAEGQNDDVDVEIWRLNEQWRISDDIPRQVLPLHRFRMDTHVNESCTFNLKPFPQNGAANDNLRQLECDVRVCQGSDQMSAVVIRAVHEIEIRPVHGNQRDRLNMRKADDSNPMPPQVYKDLLWFYKERQRKIEKGELNNPTQCSGDDSQDQAGQLNEASSLPQPNHPTGGNYGHQVQHSDGIEVRNDQSQIPDKPMSALKRVGNFITHHFKRKENDPTGFDPNYDVRHDFPPLVHDEAPYQHIHVHDIITTPTLPTEPHYMNMPLDQTDLDLENQV